MLLISCMVTDSLLANLGPYHYYQEEERHIPHFTILAKKCLLCHLVTNDFNEYTKWICHAVGFAPACPSNCGKLLDKIVFI